MKLKKEKIQANGSYWLVSGDIIETKSGIFDVKLKVVSGDVFDKAGLDEAVQNLMIDKGYI